MPRRRRRKSSFVRAAELSIAAPTVMALRTARMLAAGASPSARDRRELQRMGTEKVEAYWESMNAMALQAARQWWSLWLAPWTPPGSKASQRKLQRSVTKILEQGMIPVHRRATANARRLSRKKKGR